MDWPPADPVSVGHGTQWASWNSKHPWRCFGRSWHDVDEGPSDVSNQENMGPGSTERAEKRCVRLQSGWWGEFTVWKKKKVCTSKRTHYSTVKLFPLHLPACWEVGVRVSVKALREFGAVCQRGGVGVQTFWSVDMHSEFRNVHVGFWVKSLNMFHPTRLSAWFGLGQFSPPTSCWRELGDKSEQI